MNNRIEQKEEAMLLRKKGLSYSQIKEKLGTPKSTLSIWLQALPLTDAEKRIVKKRKDSNISRGRIRAAAANHARKEERDRSTFIEAKSQFEKQISDPFFQIGISLYWAEGTKRGPNFSFINSDPDMVCLMTTWIKQFLVADPGEIRARLFVHKFYASEENETFWAHIAGIPLSNFGKTIYKPTPSLVKKRPAYRGCLRIELGKVKYLRKMLYWQQMLIEYYKKAG